MSFSDRLKRYLSSSDVGDFAATTLSLSHPAFVGGPYHYSTDSIGFEGTLHGGGTADFIPYPFDIKTPKEDGGGTADFTISLALDDGTIFAEIERALEYRYTDAAEPIKAVIGYYMTDATAPKTGTAFQLALVPPYEVYLSQVQIRNGAVSGIASRTDIVRRAYPRAFYTPDKFPGLVRG